MTIQITPILLLCVAIAILLLLAIGGVGMIARMLVGKLRDGWLLLMFGLGIDFVAQVFLVLYRLDLVKEDIWVYVRTAALFIVVLALWHIARGLDQARRNVEKR